MIPSPDLLSCGCLLTYAIVDDLNVMTVSPCRLDCENLAFIREESARQGKPVSEVEA
jgi:hypothetical protein